MLGKTQNSHVLDCFGSMFEAKHLEEQQAHGAST